LAEPAEGDQRDHAEDDVGDRSAIGPQRVPRSRHGRLVGVPGRRRDAHQLHPFDISATAERCSLTLIRKIERISGGAAMNNTISDCRIATMSTGVPVLASICTLPARKAPKRMPASTVPSGL